jgi:superfamily I DNA and/or RNA helicase
VLIALFEFSLNISHESSQITPYAQQAALLRRTFSNGLGGDFERYVEINTVDAFQGREANIGEQWWN